MTASSSAERAAAPSSASDKAAGSSRASDRATASSPAGEAAAASPASDGKAPRTARGERTLRKILDAALAEFGERGFSESSIASITQRARVALGTFYTYFDSKEALFQALVRDMSAQVRDHVAPALSGARDGLDAEGRALLAFLEFVGGHKQVYRIIDEAEFVDPEGFRLHYETTAARIASRLKGAKGIRREPSALAEEVRAWAVMGANVFVGLRFGVWGSENPKEVARIANRILGDGIAER